MRSIYIKKLVRSHSTKRRETKKFTRDVLFLFFCFFTLRGQSDPAMDDAEGAPAPYVRLGVAADAGVGAAKSAGYVTLGDASAADVATLEVGALFS